MTAEPETLRYTLRLQRAKGSTVKSVRLRLCAECLSALESEMDTLKRLSKPDCCVLSEALRQLAESEALAYHTLNIEDDRDEDTHRGRRKKAKPKAKWYDADTIG